MSPKKRLDVLREHGKKPSISLPTEKGNRTMTQAGKRKAGDETTLVRAADGALYLLNETEKPLKLKEDTADEVTEILEDAEKKLTKVIKEDPRCDFICSRNVHVVVPEVLQ